MFWPCETRTSTCRNFATISSGLYRFLAITVLLDVKDIPQVGPLQWGRINWNRSSYLHAQGIGSGASASLFVEVPGWRDAYGGRGTVVALMGTGTVLIDDNRVGRRASPDGDRAQRVKAGFLLVTEPVVAVGYGCRVVSTDGCSRSF